MNWETVPVILAGVCVVWLGVGLVVSLLIFRKRDRERF